MKDYLEPILIEKRKTLSRKIPAEPGGIQLEERHPSFRQALKDGFCIIAEFKRASPSKGDINPGADPAKVAAMYENAGAAAVSVLTEETFFKGSLEDLKSVRNQIALPILCKDFILQRSQIDEAKAAGASIILLIVRALDNEELQDLHGYAHSIGLEVLVEVHNEEELNRAADIGAEIIGINNRNLSTFEIDLAVTEQLAQRARDAGAFVISESGISTLQDCRRVMEAGADGILVGEAFMRESNPEEMIRKMKDLRGEKIHEG
ncbi:indole-3-glycerol phosphate synthase TrpC [Peribacillus sp. SCS-37]|uniref:indole-3-glycerol phosphate synthase TrpC n=1 Tax=Paraperibacillus esterisolvens TaxID=3115296 RepID=UPI003905F0D5